MSAPRSQLADAIRQENWEKAALLLLLGVTRAARTLPPETLEQMIELLSAPAPRTGRRDRDRE